MLLVIKYYLPTLKNSVFYFSNNEVNCILHTNAKFLLIHFLYFWNLRNILNLPCLTLTNLELRAATKLAWGKESSNENSSSLVTVFDLLFSSALEPIGLKYCPCLSLSANWPLWYSAENRQSLLQVSTNLPETKPKNKSTNRRLKNKANK